MAATARLLCHHNMLKYRTSLATPLATVVAVAIAASWTRLQHQTCVTARNSQSDIFSGLTGHFKDSALRTHRAKSQSAPGFILFYRRMWFQRPATIKGAHCLRVGRFWAIQSICYEMKNLVGKIFIWEYNDSHNYPLEWCFGGCNFMTKHGPLYYCRTKNKCFTPQNARPYVPVYFQRQICLVFFF